MKNWRPIQTAFFKVLGKEQEDKIIAVSGAHLTARAENSAQRDGQFGKLDEKMKSFLQNGVRQLIVQGDMNFHSEEETSIATKRYFDDAWLTVNNLEDNPGYTFDTRFNSLIN